MKIPFPDKKYRVIYADPAWTFNTFSDKGKDRSPEQHYECMDINDIYNMPVQDIAMDDCALFIWVTFPLLKEGIQTLESWGFEYKTNAFTWAKKNSSNVGWKMGNGYYTRANAEICLLGTKGNMGPYVKDKGVPQLVVSPIREHSRKPDVVPQRIERLFDGPYIELFSRTAREGWDHWGLESGKFDG